MVAPAAEERAYWIGFNRVPGIGMVRLRRLLDAFGDIRIAWEATPARLAAAGLHGRALQALVDTRATLDIARELRRHEEAGIAIVTIDDAAYPRRLRQIDAAPPVLFVRGAICPEDEVSVAIVGTRTASTYGRGATERLAGDLARCGVTIVSGLARGIDSYAHRAALEAGGRTIAVFGCGLDTIYPSENRALAERILERGALVSEYPLGVRPEPNNFPARNRIVAGMTAATLVVEAPEKSGSLITASFAAEQGRDVLAVPGPITARGSVGTNRLIQDGARLVMNADDVRQELGLVAPAPRQAQLAIADALPASDLEASVLARLADEPLLTDDLARLLDRPVAEVATALTMLELQGRTRQVAGLNYLVHR